MSETGGSAAVPRPPSRLLIDRNLGPFLAGSLLSNIGTFMYNITAAIVVFQVTDSAFFVGVLATAQFAPAMIFAPWAGRAADRFDRRSLLLTTQAVSGTASGALALWTGAAGVDGLGGPWPVIGLSLVIGVSFAFSIPTLQAFVGSLVPPVDLEATLALNSVTFNLARAIGPALAGVAVATLGAAATFGINSLTFGVFALVLLEIGGGPAREVSGDRSFLGALRFLRVDPGIVVVLLGIAALGFASDPVNALAPAVAEEYGGGERLVGVLVSAFGAGAVIASTFVARVRRLVAKRVLATAGLATLGVGMMVVATSPLTWIAVTALVVSGFGFLMAITILTADIYGRVPDEMRGRILAMWGVAFLGSRPLAGLVDGAIADLLSTRLAVAFAASVALAMVWLLGARWTPTGASEGGIQTGGVEA